MRNHRENDRLSSGDALFLYLEREGMPLNVASVSVFEGTISLQACRRFIESKLPLIPRYRQRVVPPPFNIGVPSWGYDPHFDLRNHVRHLTLKSGTDAELKKVAGTILSKLMDRQRPLWDFTLIHGLKGNRSAVVNRMHHCLADGLAGVSLMTILMDPSAEVHLASPAKTRLPAASRRNNPTLVDELITSSVSVAERVLTAQMELFSVLQNVLQAAGQAPRDIQKLDQGHTDANIPSVDDFAEMMPEVTAATEPLPFNIICRGPQKFNWAEIPLESLKAVKRAGGATLNEVALTLVMSAIQRYVELRGVRLKDRLLRIVMPVNVRGNGNASDLGNRITFVPISIPLDIRKPRAILAGIRKRTAFLKSAHIAECVSLFGTMLGTIPTAAQQIAGPIVSQIPLGLCNIIFTNVPGPTTPLYLLGHKMVRCYPYIPIGGDLGINCAVLTYNGTAYFGFTGDVHAAPDLQRLEKFLMTSFAELRKAVGIRPQRRTRQAKGARVPAAEAPEPRPVIAPALPVAPTRTSAIRPITTKLDREELAEQIGA